MSMSLQKYDQIGVAMTCRSYAEYVRMFNLDEEKLASGPVLDIAAGAASFTAELRGREIEAKAADPMYRLSAEQIYDEGRKEIESSTSKLARMKDQYDWSYYGSIEEHRDNRIRSLDKFIAHYNSQQAGTDRIYTAASLPELPFPDESFQTVLCSHFLFLYHEQFDYSFHLKAIQELLRVCRKDGEVRLYPLVSLAWEPYPFLEDLTDYLERGGVRCEFANTFLPFVPKPSRVLCLRRG
jgi:SAM-dependent methyltransferase